MLSRHILHNLNARQVARATMGALNAIQDFPKGTQCAAICLLYTTLCNRLDMPLNTLHEFARNVAGCEPRRPEFRGIEQYMLNQF